MIERTPPILYNLYQVRKIVHQANTQRTVNATVIEPKNLQLCPSAVPDSVPHDLLFIGISVGFPVRDKIPVFFHISSTQKEQVPPY